MSEKYAHSQQGQQNSVDIDQLLSTHFSFGKKFMNNYFLPVELQEFWNLRRQYIHEQSFQLSGECLSIQHITRRVKY